MDILRIQDLIADRRVTTLADIDPTKAYLQYGLFQNGNRSSNASNADTYKSYVIPVSELIGGTPPVVTDFKNYLLVDAKYGNDGTAVKNNDLLPYLTIDAAIAAASSFDVIIVNPGDYFSFSNTMRPGGGPGTITYYLHAGVTWTSISPSGNGCTDPGTSYYIYGHGNITFSVRPFSVIGDYSGEIVIECNTLRFAFGGYMLLQNTSYLNAASFPENLSIKCRVLKLDDVTGIIYTLPWQVNIEAERLESTIYGPGGFGISEIWQGGDAQNPFNPLPIKTVINIGKVVKNNSAGCTFMNIVGGKSVNENYINANIDQLPHSTSIAHMFRLQGTTSKVFYDGVATIVDSGMVYDQSGAAPFVQLKGKVYHSDTYKSLLTTPYYIQSLKLELRNDTISSSANNSIVILTAGQVDVVSAKLVSTDGSGLAPALIDKTGGLGKLRLRNAYIISQGPTSILGTGAEPYEVYSGFTNFAPVGMNNVLATTLLVDSNITDNNL